MKKTGASGHTRKHTGTRKHTSTSKHHPVHHRAAATAHGTKVTAKAKHPSHAKARGLAIGDALPVCTFEALAASLRLAGQRVHEDDVGQLWTLAGAREVSIEAALLAATEYGLAGVRLVSYREITPGTAFPLREGRLHCSILGVDLPGPHAVAAVPGGWLSWGSLYSPWTTAVSEAWAVSWG